MPDEVHVRIEGRVQGVGFRYATAQRASELGINGWVRNLHDGSVEAVFQGSDDAIAEMKAWIDAGGPPLGRVTDVESRTRPAAQVFDGFSIRT